MLMRKERNGLPRSWPGGNSKSRVFKKKKNSGGSSMIGGRKEKHASLLSKRSSRRREKKAEYARSAKGGTCVVNKLERLLRRRLGRRGDQKVSQKESRFVPWENEEHPQGKKGGREVDLRQGRRDVGQDIALGKGGCEHLTAIPFE